MGLLNLWLGASGRSHLNLGATRGLYPVEADRYIFSSQILHNPMAAAAETLQITYRYWEGSAWLNYVMMLAAVEGGSEQAQQGALPADTKIWMVMLKQLS